MKPIYLYLLDTMADWEVGYAIAELNSQRFFGERKEWKVVTCALGKAPVRTAGGVTLLPDVELASVEVSDAVMLILPGADTWLRPEQAPTLKLVREFLSAGVPVAAICGATGALAEAGILDAVQHTSNGAPYLEMFCPHYRGQANYREELAVTDGNLITAGSSSSVEFACHIFKKLGAFTPETLEHWYAYFAKHSAPDMMKLLGA